MHVCMGGGEGGEGERGGREERERECVCVDGFIVECPSSANKKSEIKDVILMVKFTGSGGDVTPTF